MNLIDNISGNATDPRGEGQKGTGKDGLDRIADKVLVNQLFLGLTGRLNFLRKGHKDLLVNL